MIKVTAETMLIQQDVHCSDSISEKPARHWFNRVDGIIEGIRYRLLKLKMNRQEADVELFVSNYAGCANVPHRIWKRHSAFLVYHHLMQEQQAVALRCNSQQPESVDTGESLSQCA